MAAGAVVKAVARESDGTEIHTSAPFAVDVVPPADPTINIASGTTISGSAEAGSTVEVDTDGDSAADYTTTADENGDWSISLDPALTDGTTVSATATDASGNTSGATMREVDAIAPDVPVIRVATGEQVSGTAEAGTTITVTDDDNNEYTATVAVDGTWSISGLALSDGTPISVTATDADGNVSSPGTATADASAPDAPTITSTSAAEVSGTAEADSVITFVDTAGAEHVRYHRR